MSPRKRRTSKQKEEKKPDKRYPWYKFPENCPLLYEMCLVEDDNGEQRYGWWDGKSWEYGLRKLHGEITRWKIAKTELYHALNSRKKSKDEKRHI